MDASGKSKNSFGRFFRSTFLRGLAALLPAIVTIWLLVKVVELLNTYAAVPITHLPILILKTFNADPVLVEKLTTFSNSWAIRLLAFLLTVVLVCLLGAVLVRTVGRKLWSALVENAFGRLPVIKAIYPRIKQLSDFLFTEAATPARVSLRGGGGIPPQGGVFDRVYHGRRSDGRGRGHGSSPGDGVRAQFADPSDRVYDPGVDRRGDPVEPDARADRAHAGQRRGDFPGARPHVPG